LTARSFQRQAEEAVYLAEGGVASSTGAAEQHRTGRGKTLVGAEKVTSRSLDEVGICGKDTKIDPSDDGGPRRIGEPLGTSNSLGEVRYASGTVVVLVDHILRLEERRGLRRSPPEVSAGVSLALRTSGVLDSPRQCGETVNKSRVQSVADAEAGRAEAALRVRLAVTIVRHSVGAVLGSTHSRTRGTNVPGNDQGSDRKEASEESIAPLMVERTDEAGKGQ
jgi:hypothetical protein